MKIADTAFFIVMSMILGILIGIEVGKADADSKLKKAAVEIGAAEWAVVNEYGQTRFQWKTDCIDKVEQR